MFTICIYWLDFTDVNEELKLRNSVFQMISSSVFSFTRFCELLNLSLLCSISYSKASIRTVCLFLNALYNDKISLV